MRYVIITVCLFAILPLIIGEAKAQRLITDISEDEIAIRTNFIGTKILVFGAIGDVNIDDAHDVIVAVRGPRRAVTIRKKENIAGFWVNRDYMRLRALPYFYALASNRPINEIISPSQRIGLEIGAAHLGYQYEGQNRASLNQQDYITALQRIKTAQSLYKEDEAGVQIIDQHLFRAAIELPSGVSTGVYYIHVYLFKNGHLIQQTVRDLQVNHIGLEQFLHDLAYQAPLLYGLIGVLIAAATGWMAARLFRRY